MGDGGGDTPAKIPNPYRAAIQAARERSVGPAGTLREALDKAERAFGAGAWSGGKADAFGGSLDGWRTTAGRAATDALDDFDEAIGNQDAMVDPNSWQVRWRNMRL